jgi:hypothetical protein
MSLENGSKITSPFSIGAAVSSRLRKPASSRTHRLSGDP